MSGAQTSPFLTTNELLAPMAAYDMHANALLEAQGRQQTIAANNTEVVARAASTLLDPTLYPDEAARAAAWPGIIKQLKGSGYAPNAPDYYPGEQHLRLTARLGTPSADLYKLGADRQAKGAIAPGDGGTTATGGTGGGGGGTGTVGGTDTAPINAAGDSRTRKAGEGGPPAAGSPGSVVAKQVHDFWISKGFSEEQTAGIMAGGPGSESDFTPTASGDKGTSYGLYQHHAERLDGMRKMFGLSGSQMPTADQQNQYAYWEITQGPYAKTVGEPLKNARTPAEAAAIWTQYFGVPADKTEIGRRAAGAQRFMGIYGQPQGAPGGPPGVQMGGAPPPPPGGAPGAYGGGGFGAAVGRPPVVGTSPLPAGRPTGPPVVTDQPAGSGVVAGPPGVATVGAPQPPGPAVPGNVDAINAGIVARGGQPATDPYATPTPARYAGTAPAPSVEAAPETGWGTGIGSGYGPQNTLAPPPPQPPARPATPATTAAATQPPAADTLPPLPAPTPPAPTNRNGLTAFQQQDIDRRRGMTNVSADELQKRVDSYVATNAAVAEKFQQDQIAYVREARERQSSAQAQQDRAQAQQLAREAAQRDAERLKIAQDAAQAARAKEDREAVEANKPFHGNTPDAQNRNILIDGTNSGKTDTTEYSSAYADYGTEKVDANGLKYRPDMSPYATPTGKTYGEGKGGRDLGRADIGQGPLPPPVIYTAIQGNLAGLRNVERALKELDAHPDSVGITGLQPEWLSQRTDPEGIKLRADISDILSQVFHERSGAAVMVQEAARMKPFVPSQVDTATALRTKLERIRQNYLDTLYDHYSTYGPEGGGRTMPRVETALKGYSPDTSTSSLPQAKTEADVKALPSGAVFTAPDGTRRFKP